MYSSEVLVDKKDKERLMELMDEAHSILEKYESSSDYKSHFVTTMMRAKGSVSEARQWCELLHTKKN